MISNVMSAFGLNLGVGLTAFLFGIAVFLVVYAIKAPINDLPSNDYREALGLDIVASANPGGLFERMVRPALRNFMPQTPLSAVLKARQNNKTVELLVRSGNPWNIQPEEFMGLQCLSALAGIFGGLGLSIAGILPTMLPRPAWMVVGAGVGFILPKYVLNKHKAKRQKAAQRGLPEALDLLRITLGSGQTFQTALVEVCSRLPEGIVRDELSRVSDDIRAGRPLEKALVDFARRAPSDEIESFCKAVVQSERLGADMTRTLERQSQAARQSYEAELDKKIGALPTTMFFPILGLMLPALFIVLLAPAFTSIGKAF